MSWGITTVFKNFSSHDSTLVFSTVFVFSPPLAKARLPLFFFARVSCCSRVPRLSFNALCWVFSLASDNVYNLLVRTPCQGLVASLLTGLPPAHPTLGVLSPRAPRFLPLDVASASPHHNWQKQRHPICAHSSQRQRGRSRQSSQVPAQHPQWNGVCPFQWGPASCPAV